MAPNPKVAEAFRAMKNIGISEQKVKPVLKNLLKLYDKNWSLIEEENYRVLADAIFEFEEAEARQQEKKLKNAHVEDAEEGAEENDEPERPLKRLRLRYQGGQTSAAPNCPGSASAGTSLVTPKVERAELPEPQLQSLSQAIVHAPRPSPKIINTRNDSHPAASQPVNEGKGKQPLSTKPLTVQERSVASLPDGAERIQPNKMPQSNPNPHPMRLRDRGRDTLSPQAASRDKKAVPGTSSSAICLKEPKVEPGTELLPKETVPGTLSLPKPKDEPFTDIDERPQFDVPVADDHPEFTDNGGALTRSGSTKEQDRCVPMERLSVKGKVVACEDNPAASSEPQTNLDLAVIMDESSSHLEIASSPLGEVTISFSCSSAQGRPDFRMPSLDEVLKSVESKCLRSYKILDPNFSVMKVMKDMCECFLELGTESTSEPLNIINVGPAIDLLDRTSAPDARGVLSDQMNGPINSELGVGTSLPQVTQHSPPCDVVNEIMQADKVASAEDCRTDETDVNDGLNDTEEANSQSLVVVQQPELVPEILRPRHDVIDIAKGQERVIISLVNDVNSEYPSFHYIPQNVVFQNAYVNFSLARIGDDNSCSSCVGDCLSLSTPCACAHEIGGEFAYTSEGLVKEELLKESISMNRNPEKHCQFFCKECPLERSKNEDIVEPCKGHLVRKFIKECWWKCGCGKECGNRVVQRGISRQLQVFMTPGGKGWGLRTLEDLPKGAFVCEYVGEILTNAELFDRVSRSPEGEGHSYPVLLDADWGSEVVLKDEEALCLDATYYGNVARFINHRCYDSNLVEIPVEVETPDHHYYHLAFFTTRKVKAMEELTWDYGIDFDDHDHPVKAFCCQCGSKFCRNIKRSRSRSSRR